MTENLDDDRRIFNGRQDGQRAAALGTDGDVDSEDAFESLRPAHAGPRGGRGAIAGVSSEVSTLIWVGGNNLGPQRGVGGQHAMEANEMEAWTRDERGQVLDPFRQNHPPIITAEFPAKGQDEIFNVIFKGSLIHRCRSAKSGD